MKDVLKCAMTECGWLFMTVGGATIMPWWCADSLDIHINVSYDECIMHVDFITGIKPVYQKVQYLSHISTTGAIPYGGYYFGKGKSLLEYYSVACTGNEATITQCSYSTIPRLTSIDYFYPNGYSTSNNSAGVSCLGPPTNIPECSNGDVILTEGPSTREGRLKICRRDGFWASVCVSGIDQTAALIVCRSLGLNATGL